MTHIFHLLERIFPTKINRLRTTKTSTMFLQFCFLLLLYVHTHGHCQYVATETIGSLMNERGAAKKKRKIIRFHTHAQALANTSNRTKRGRHLHFSQLEIDYKYAPKRT